HRTLSLRRAAVLLLIAALPTVGFASLFASVDGKALGNLAGLSDLAEKQSGSVGTYVQALYHLFRTGPGLMVVLALTALLNFRQLRTIRGQFGIVLLIISIAGYVIFAQCCSYHERNGWWILSLLTGSALLGVTGFGRKEI